MKCIAVLLAVLAVSVNCNPNVARQTRFIDGIIRDAIAELSQDIVDSGLDPLDVEAYAGDIDVFPYVSGEYVIEDLHASGLSNIAINQINFATLRGILTFDISLPEILVTLGNAETDLLIVGNRVRANANGRVSIKDIRAVGEINVNVGILSGVSIRGVDISLSLGGVESALNVVAQGNDFSSTVNSVLAETIPGLIHDYQDQINSFVEDLIWSLVD